MSSADTPQPIPFHLCVDPNDAAPPAPGVLAERAFAYIGAPLSRDAFRERKHLANRFQQGEGLVGQCVKHKT